MEKKNLASSSTLNRAAPVIAAPAGNGALKDRGPVQEAGSEKIIIVHREAIGSSGTRNFSGYPSEEYFQKLRGHAAADLYDQMRRGESQIKMCLKAVKNPIMAADWKVQPPKADAKMKDGDELAEFCEHILFEDMQRPWSQFMNEALTVVDFGHSVFEVVHKIVKDHPKWGSYNGIKVLGWRNPRTLYRWNLDREAGIGLKSVTQNSFGDLQRLVDIDGQFLMVLTLEQEGDNYEGISMLRAAYGPWLRKQEYLVMQAIGIEKFAIPTPIGTIPEGKQNSDQAANFEAALQNFTAHEKSYLVLPPGDWKVDFVGASGKGGFDPEKVQTAINAEDRNIVKAFVANFLELGQTGTGSYSLSFDQSDFFLSSIEHIARMVCDSINKSVLRPLIDMNFGPQEAYPELTYSGISDEAGKELAESLKYLAEAQILIPDDDLEDHIRARFRLSKRSEEGQRKVQAKGAEGLGDATQEDDQSPMKGHNPADPNDVAHPDHPEHAAFQKQMDDHAAKKAADQTVPPKGKPDQTVPAAKPPKDVPPPVDPKAKKKADDKKLSERILLAEKQAHQQIEAAHDALLAGMKAGLSGLAASFVDQVMKAYRSATPAEKVNAAKGVKPVGIKNYQASLTQALANISGRALAKAKKEVPDSKTKKFSEILFARDNEKPIKLSDLPPELQKKVQNKAAALSDSQAADLEKAIVFQFQSSEPSTDSESRLEADLEEAVDKYLDDSASLVAAAGNAAAHAVNDARNAYFFDDDTLEEIESFTFVNGDPVSPICQDLAGTTFDKDDPDAQRYFPPLHHNCKSYIVPNLVGAKDNPEIDPTGLTPSDPSLEKHITLSKG